eukprot:8611221-Lingulodinium_polyedra.AAC.1
MSRLRASCKKSINDSTLAVGAKTRMVPTSGSWWPLRHHRLLATGGHDGPPPQASTAESSG